MKANLTYNGYTLSNVVVNIYGDYCHVENQNSAEDGIFWVKALRDEDRPNQLGAAPGCVVLPLSAVEIEEVKEMYSTNYRVAVEWLGGSLIMCNNIAEIDPAIYDEMRFSYYDDETDKYTEIYQYFLTNYSLSDVEYLEETFGLLFTYSPALDLFILCVDHFGTAWDYVHCYTSDPYAARELGERK